jgi:hypothetical protein
VRAGIGFDVPPLRAPLLRPRAGWALLAALGLGSCQVVPPTEGAASRAGFVRADTEERAVEVAGLLDRLAPEVLARVPGSEARELEVWVQESPALYRFALSSYDDADGFWAASPARIHLRERADNLERTLAHELVHASLGRSWSALPGTLEEGLCDALSAELCPGAAARMRAGRLSSAVFATGGLVLDLELALPAALHPLGVEVAFRARLRLESDPPSELEPLDVFRVAAGLSSSDVAPEQKKAYYGLSYLVVERILARRGVEGLHDLCTQALRDGHRRVPRQRLLAAAELGTDAESWRRALLEGFGPAELVELVRMHPDFLVDTLRRFLGPCLGGVDPDALLAGLGAELVIAESGTRIALLEVDEVRRALRQAWTFPGPGPGPAP